MPLRVVHMHGGRRPCGVSRHIFTALTHLDATRVQGQLLLLRGGAVAEEAETRGVEAHVCGPRFAGDPTAILRIAQSLRSRRADILHTHTLNCNFYGRAAARLLPQLRVVSSVHTFIGRGLPGIYPNPLARRLVAASNAFTGRWAHLFVATCSALEQDLRAAGVPEQRLRLLYNGMDLAALPAPTPAERAAARATIGISGDAPCVGCVGRLVGVKRVDLLLDAVHALKGRFEGLRLLVVGDGPLRSELVAYAAAKGLGDAVQFMGWQDDVRTALLAMDVHAMSSESEAFPYSVMEAMAAALPTVAFDTGGLRDLIVPATGVLVDPAEPAAIGSVIGELLADPDRCRTMGDAARMRAATCFEASRMAADLERIYRDAMKTKGRIGRLVQP